MAPWATPGYAHVRWYCYPKPTAFLTKKISTEAENCKIHSEVATFHQRHHNKQSTYVDRLGYRSEGRSFVSVKFIRHCSLEVLHNEFTAHELIVVNGLHRFVV